MKKGYKIGLFFVIILIMALIGIIMYRRAIMKPQNSDTDIIPNVKAQDKTIIRDVETDNTILRTTCDTKILYQNIDRKDDSTSFNEERIPDKYVNLTRDELERLVEEDNKVKTLEEKSKGFVSQHLELFSAERIKITRIYDTSVEKIGYYLMATDNKIWIYESDKKTVYFKTDLNLEDVPEQLQIEIMGGKFMNSEIEIYHFLESYSS